MHERMRDLPRHSELRVPFMHLCHGRRLAANSVVVCATKCTCREVEICASPSLLSSKGIHTFCFLQHFVSFEAAEYRSDSVASQQ